VLLCGDCPYRSKWSCTHPNLKANGGSGLAVQPYNPLGGATVHLNYGAKGGRYWDPTVYDKCEGHPTRKPDPIPEKPKDNP
jgi:hypothetical protein